MCLSLKIKAYNEINFTNIALVITKEKKAKEAWMIKKVLSIIPARGGSKELPRKNIIDLVGKPLIAWTIEASLNSKYITKTLVSSDDKEILNIAEEYGAKVIKRPDNLATDDSTSIAVVEQAIDILRSNKEEFDILVLLQPTSPLRTCVDIDAALDIFFENSKVTSVISGFKVDNKFLKSLIISQPDSLLTPINTNYFSRRRQDLPDTFMPNGAIYIIDIKDFCKNKGFFTAKTLAYEMSKEHSIDIDLLKDLNLAQKIIKNRGSA